MSELDGIVLAVDMTDSSVASIVRTVAAYVPSCLVRQILADRTPAPGETEALEAAVLFADISGFTPMAEALARAGRRGAEEMTHHLNATFSATIARVTAHGGDVAAFGGDAILAFFAPQTDESAEVVAWRALTCALEMRQAMASFAHVETAVGPFSLRMKFGLSFGHIIAASIGSPQRGLEFVIAGAPVDRAVDNENHAQSGQIVVDASALNLVGGRVTVQAIASDIGQVLDADPAPASTRPPIDYERLTAQQRRRILDTVALYLPPELYADLTSKGHFVGDHRPVTSLFVNFAGLDYERDSHVGARLQTYITRAQEIIHRYDGNLNRVLTGDKGSQLHILFGAPVAHEDDKARALRCALTLQRELGAFSFIQAQRIGLASGYVFAGPVGAMAQGGPDGEDWLPVTRGEYTVMGDIVNLSARLTGVCPPGGVLADAYTRSRTAQRFEFQSIGPVELKGKAQPVTPFVVKRERPTDNALVTRYLLSQRPLVGRRDEMARIRQAVSAASAGDGRILIITGPAGVGKSRLIEEAVRRWLQGGGIGYGGDCMSHGTEIPYSPWADLWRAQFGLQENDTPAERREKILGFGQTVGMDLSEWAALVAGLLGLRPEVAAGGTDVDAPADEEEHPALAPLDPEARHRRLLDLTADLVATQARQTPILLLFEDLHWADRASQELIDYVAGRIADLPVLICIAHRPRDEIALSCREQPYCHALSLKELSDEEGTALVRAMLGDLELPAAFLRLVNAKAQGNPLFVEELVNGLVDAGLLQRQNGTYRVRGALDQIEVPDTVQAVLLARIDRLEAPARDLLRVASVIGRQFAYAVLRGIYPFVISDAEMLDRLTSLERLDLTRLERPEPELEYLFKHALTQEVAYENLSFALRRDLHKRIGRFLESHYGDHLETLYGTLAHHFAQGAQPVQALSYALAAGEQAQELFANQEALAHYRQAESLLAQLPSPGQEEATIRLYLKRGELHTLLGNFDQAEADLERALAVARAERDHRAQAQALNGLAYLRWWQTRNEEMLQLAQRALGLAEAESYPRETMVALRYAANALEELGHHDEAIAFFSRARTLAEELDDRRALSTIHMGVAVAAFNQGQLQSARDALERLLVIYRESGDKHRTADCLSNIANTEYYLGNFDAARAAFQESIAIDREIGKRAGLAYSLIDLGTLHCHRGAYAAGLDAMEEAADIFEEIGDEGGRAWCDRALGREYHLDAGPASRAETLLRRALPVFEASESYEEAAETLLGLGRLALRGEAYDRAQAGLERALALCQTHDLKWRLPEASVRLAELALARGDAERALEWARRTLTAIAEGGCPDLAPAAHLVLARVTDEPLTHFQSAVRAARRRSRRIDLAETLVEAGRYLRERTEAELRAQGRAYLREAQLLLEEMALPTRP